MQGDLQRQSGPQRRDPGICCCEKLSSAASSSGVPQMRVDRRGCRDHNNRKETCLCGVTHLVGVLRVQLGLRILSLFLGRSCLAALAAGGPPPPRLCACTHHPSFSVWERSGTNVAGLLVAQPFSQARV